MDLRLPEASSSNKSKSKGKGKGKGKESDVIGAGLELATTSSSRLSGKSKNGEGTDWIEATINGGSVLLNIVREASSVAPVPYLKQAAGVTLKIVEVVQAVRENKAAFKRLAQQSMELIATVYSAYQRSPNKEEWPPQEINVVIVDLLETLKAILAAIQQHLNRSKLVRVVYSVADAGKIEEFRQNLQAAVSKFEELIKVSSHLGLHDALSQVLKNQTKEEDERRQAKLQQAQHDIEEVHRIRVEEEHEARIREEARREQEEEDNRRRLEASEQEIIAQQRRIEELDTQNAILRIKAADDERERRVRAEEEEYLRRRREDEEEAIRERERQRARQAQEDSELLERIRTKEREKIERESRLRKEAKAEDARIARMIQDALDREEKRRQEIDREYEEERLQAEADYAPSGSSGSKRPVKSSSGRKPAAESEDDDEESASAEGADEDAECESEPEQSRPPPKQKVERPTRPKSKKKIPKKEPSPDVEAIGSQFGQIDLNNPNPFNAWQYGHYAGLSFPSQLHSPISPPLYSTPYSGYPLMNQAYLGYSPTSSPPAGGVTIHNVNSGNYSSVVIKGSGGNSSKPTTSRSTSSKKTPKKKGGS